MTDRIVSGRRVSPVGMGCMGLTHASGAPMTTADAAKVVREAFELGYTFFDTAECYTGVFPDGSTAYNEEPVGEALRPIRQKVFLATKFGVQHSDKGLLVDSRPETIRASVEGSLKRLGTDCIDLYYQHRIDPKVTPEEVAGTMADLIREGKILSWGISETTENYLRRAHAICPVTAIQNRYSMMYRDYDTIFPTLDELNVGYVAFSPLANGVLSDRYGKDSKFEAGTDYRSFMPQFKPEAFDENAQLFAYIRSLAEEKNATPAQISLAWMIHKHKNLVPIPGTRKLDRLKENGAAGDILLTAEEVAAIDQKLDTIPISGIFGGSGAAKK